MKCIKKLQGIILNEFKKFEHQLIDADDYNNQFSLWNAGLFGNEQILIYKI